MSDVTETSDQGNMVSQRQGEWVLVPREPTARMLADAVMYAVAHEPSKADMAITGAVLEFLPPTGHPDARAVIAEIARDYRALLLSAPPAEPRADEGGVSRSQPIFGSVPLPTREAEEPAAVIQQRADDDCTICSIAMAIGLPYERVMEAAAQSVGGYRYQGKPGTMSPKGVLLDLGFDVVRVGVAAVQPATLKRLLWGRRAVLSVPSLNGFDGHHDVFWDGREIHDPTTKRAYTADMMGDHPPIWAVLLDCASTEAAPQGAEPDATGIDRGRDEQIIQPSHDDEGLKPGDIEWLAKLEHAFGGRWTHRKDRIRRLVSALDQAANTISRLKGERDELQRTFDLRWQADQRAIALWQALNPGTDLTWPDRTDMVVWLLETLDQIEMAEVAGWPWPSEQTLDELAALSGRDRAAATQLAIDLGKMFGVSPGFAAHHYIADKGAERSLQLEAEVKELREALKPFADAGAQVPPPVSDGATCTYYRDSVFTAAHFRKARSLLSPAQEGLSSARASRDARSSTRPEGQSVDGGEG